MRAPTWWRVCIVRRVRGPPTEGQAMKLSTAKFSYAGGRIACYAMGPFEMAVAECAFCNCRCAKAGCRRLSNRKSICIAVRLVIENGWCCADAFGRYSSVKYSDTVYCSLCACVWSPSSTLNG